MTDDSIEEAIYERQQGDAFRLAGKNDEAQLSYARALSILQDGQSNVTRKPRHLLNLGLTYKGLIKVAVGGAGRALWSSLIAGHELPAPSPESHPVQQWEAEAYNIDSVLLSIDPSGGQDLKEMAECIAEMAEAEVRGNPRQETRFRMRYLDLLQAIRKDTSSDVGIANALARCHLRLGDLELMGGKVSVFHFEEALEALGLFRLCPDECSPETLRLTIDAALAAVSCCRGACANVDRAHEHLLEAVRCADVLTGKLADASEGFRIQLHSLCSLAHFQSRAGRSAEVVDVCLKAIVIADKLLLAGEESDWLLSDTVWLCDVIGESHRLLGDLGGAATWYERVLELNRKRLAACPAPIAPLDDAYWRLLDVSKSLCNLGEINIALGRLDAAYGLFSEKLCLDRSNQWRSVYLSDVVRELSVDSRMICAIESKRGNVKYAVRNLRVAMRTISELPSNWESWPEDALQLTITLLDIDSFDVPGEAESMTPGEALTFWASLWLALLEHLECGDVDCLRRALPKVARFHALWLRFALEHAPERVPEVLAAMQGRKLAAMVLDELEQQPIAEGPDAELRQRFLALRRELRRLALGLQVIEGGAGSAGSDGHRGFGLERSGSAPPEVVRARQAEYDAVLSQYRQVRLELSQRPGYEALAPQTIDLAGLQPSLGIDQALVLLVHTPTEAEGQGSTALAPAYALVLRSDRHALVPVPELAHSPRRMQFTAAAHSRMAGMRYAARMAEEATADAEVDAKADAATPLPEHLAQALWEPLREHLQGVRVLHVVTHGVFHVLPLQALAPEGLEVRQVPGLLFYWLQHLAPQRSTEPPEPTSAVQVHSPEPGTRPPPIPFVHAEADVLSALWNQKVRNPVPLAEPRALAVVHLAGHGDAGTGADASLLIGPGDRLDLHKVLGGQLRAPLVFLSACLVGRTTEDIDGDPLGLVSAYLLKGTRTVVAPLVPIPDRYAPVLAALWHWDIVHQIQQGKGLDAHRALGWAKARLRDGHWPEPVVQRLQQAYAKTMAEETSRICEGLRKHSEKADVFVPLEKQFKAWLGDEVTTRDLVLQCCVDIDAAQPHARQGVIDRAAEALAGHMMGQRHGFASRAEVRALLEFVQVYGTSPTVRVDVIAA